MLIVPGGRLNFALGVVSWLSFSFFCVWLGFSPHCMLSAYQAASLACPLAFAGDGNAVVSHGRVRLRHLRPCNWAWFGSGRPVCRLSPHITHGASDASRESRALLASVARFGVFVRCRLGFLRAFWHPNISVKRDAPDVGGFLGLFYNPGLWLRPRHPNGAPLTSIYGLPVFASFFFLIALVSKRSCFHISGLLLGS